MSLRFRQIHLDFHTSHEIPDVGGAFKKEEFQQTLTEAAVDSITCFSLCHHGWSYHPTNVGKMHPSLRFDLLRAQIDAAHEVGINVPVYISAGGNDVAALAHPDWCEVRPSGVRGWGAPDDQTPGFIKLCFNTAYLDYLCAIIEEVVTRYPDADGLFFDIVLQRQCVCPKCAADMREAGLDPQNEIERKQFAYTVLRRYYDRTTAVIRKHHPSLAIFHNSGNVDPGRPELLKYFSHLELESLPTGGWGYDHFPLSAAFARTTGKAFSGMTGKFHSTWGEFGGFKHPNALRYECCAMLAYGARCSVGDQMHPCGKLDPSTYKLVGRAYRDVRDKEAFCRDAVTVSEIALLTAASTGNGDQDGDIGASRILLEGHFLFDAPLPSSDWSNYKMLIISDGAIMTEALKSKIVDYIRGGGKVVAAARVWCQLEIECGAKIGQDSIYSPNYILPETQFRPDFLTTPFVMYGTTVELVPDNGAQSIGQVYYPYFNRTLGHFCSHQHTPNRNEASGFSGGIISRNSAIFAHNVFTLYRKNGSSVLRHFITSVLDTLIGDDRILHTNLPSCARTNVTFDARAGRYIVHLLYAPMLKRGENVEIIEDLLPLNDIEITLRVSAPVKSVRLEPEGTELPFSCDGNMVTVKIPSFICHQMVAVYLHIG